MKLKEYFKHKRKIKLIKQNFEKVVRELQLFNSLGEYPSDLGIRFIDYGYQLSFNIAGICDYSKLEKSKNFIADVLGAVQLETENQTGTVKLKVYTENLKELDYKNQLLAPKTLLLGYNYDGYLTVDFERVPHLLIAGLSGNGKSRMVNYMINNITRADIVVLNGYEKDYKGFMLINGQSEIEVYLKSILEDNKIRDKPLYIVLEELQAISTNKKLGSLCKELLSYGRHKNIWCIGIIQIATKQNCTFKDLFNSRLTFKQIDSSAYQVCLGVPVDKDLKFREFYLYGDNGVQKGKTFNNLY